MKQSVSRVSSINPGGHAHWNTLVGVVTIAVEPFLLEAMVLPQLPTL